MKKSLIAAIILVNVFLACKKEDRICSCYVTKTGTSTTNSSLSFSLPLIGNVPLIDTSYTNQVNEVNSVDRTYFKMTKKQAEKACVSYKEPYHEVHLNTAPPLTLTTTEDGTKTYDCKIK